jgi:glycosyltransferase involved in cell wall biosynthesis
MTWCAAAIPRNGNGGIFWNCCDDVSASTNRASFLKGRPVRIVHFSKYDRKGGASLAAFASASAQLEAGAEVLLFVGGRAGPEPLVAGPTGVGLLRSYANFVAERLPFRLLGNKDVRSLGATGLDAPAVARRFGADIVVLHNIDGLIKVADLPRFHCPVVWRTHDMWPMCGTEHYVGDSTPFRTGDVGAIGSRLSRWTFRRKLRSYPKVRSLTVCAPSKWLRDEMADSLLLRGRRVVAIANSVDERSFHPVDPIDARRELGLPHAVPLVLFGAVGGASDPRKGFDLLVAALRSAERPLHEAGAQLVVFGGDAEASDLPSLPLHKVGTIANRAKLRLLYCAANLTVVPSRLENLSLTVLESLACGTPVAAFRIGGMPDMIRHGQNGWLAQPFNSEQLGQLIVQGLKPVAYAWSRDQRAAETHHCFSRSGEASQMLSLFQEVVGPNAQEFKNPQTRVANE